MECEEMRRDSEMEADSDHDDGDYGADEIGGDGEWIGNSMHNFQTDLDSHETGTVRRRAKTIVTPKMAMESFRLSFLNDDQDVNFDAILGELYELESQLNSAQTELSRSLGAGCHHHPPPPAAFQDGDDQDSNEMTHMSEQEELDQLAVEITRSLHHSKAGGHCHQHHRHYHHHHTGMAGGEGVCDTTETDSAFSDNASLPSSESLTSMVTVSSCADTNSSSSGDTSSMSSALCGIHHGEADQSARTKAEKIRIAIEKIKEAKIRKLFVRAFAKDGSSKSILVDEKMSVSQVCSQLADKNHMRLNHRLSVVEMMPELLMERILEDHDSLVENIVIWTRDSKNKIMFEERVDKYDLFINPEKYLLGPTVLKPDSLTSMQKDKLIQDFFAPDSVSVPSVEGALYLKSDGKKAWKKFFFVLRASGLYYNPKGKASKNPKDLMCLVQFEFVEVYRGLGWKKKYHSPTDFCFALKHPQIQKKTSKYIRYFCAETETALDQWVMGIRTVKLGKQMLYNYEQLLHEISMWDLRQQEPGAVSTEESICQMLNHTDLTGSRMSVPKQDGHHLIGQSHNSALSESSRDVISIEVLAIPPCKTSAEYGGGPDGRSLSGSIGSSSAGSVISESGHKTPVKRVSFSATHSIINGNSEHVVKHRDSIISASTDSSEDSNSSGEIRLGSSFRSKMRAKLPLTTETTRQLADMCNVSIDETAEGIYAETHHRGSNAGLSRCDRRRSSVNDGSGSNALNNGQRSSHLKNSSLSPNLKQQHSLDSGAEISVRGKHGSNSPEGHYQHVRRKSEPLVVPHPAKGKDESDNSTYSTIYSPLREEQRMYEEGGIMFTTANDQNHSEPLYNQIRSPPPSWSSQISSYSISPTTIPPPPEFRETTNNSNHISLSSHTHPDIAPLPAPPVYVQSMQVPPPPPPVSSNSFVDAAETNQQKLHYLKESPYGTATSAHSSHHKSSPPPTFPKPHSSTAANNVNNSTAANNVNSTPLPPALIPKQSPPPPPLRLSSSESSCTSRSGLDSGSGSPLHVPVPPPMPPLTPKLPPPTLPKTSIATAAISPCVIGNSIKSSLSSKPSFDGQPNKENSQSDQAQTNQEGLHKNVLDEMASCPPLSPSLPFLCELSKKTHSELEADNSSVETRNGQPLSVSQQHRRSASAGGMVDKRALPPPPPKRSENTKLSGDLVRKQQQHSETAHNGTPLPVIDPIYENFDGIMDIDELPPPPPELLMDLPTSECEDQNSGSTKKSKPPPPPPKRSKETHLSSQ